MKSTKTNIPILFLGTQMEVAGAQRMLLSQARWFQGEGYMVQAVFFYDKQGLRDGWQRAHQFPVLSLEARKPNSDSISNTIRLFRAFWRLFRILRSGIKVIITYTPHSNLIGLPLAWLARVPVRIGTHHGYIEGSSRLLAWFHGRLTNSRICSIMVAVSAQVQHYAITHEGVTPTRITVIQNGIDPLDVVSNKPWLRENLRTQLGIPEDNLLILTVGRLTQQKGHTYLLDAISRIAPRFSGVRFIFAGDGSLRPNLEAKARNLGISDKVIFLGIRDDIGDLLFSSDVFAQPSLWEGLSLALLEALMAGIPVLATQVEGVVDVVEHGKSAWLVPPKDAESLATGLERLITDNNLRSQLSKEGQARAQKSYSIDTMCRAYEQLIKSLLPDAS